MGEVKRVFVGGLTPDITQQELTERFQRFGEVIDVQIKKKRDLQGAPEKTFAYLNMKSTPENLQKCFSLYNKTKWKGSELKIQLAKENFLTRLEMERKNAPDVSEKKSIKDSVEYHNPFENLPDPSVPELRGCVPGTQVPGEKNWVVGKYGRVLPVVYVKNKEKKKIIKVDPSKFCHNVKRIKDDETDLSSEPNNKKLTLQLEERDTDIVKKRKGEFPEWKPSPRKKKNIDFDKLRELYLNNDNVPKPIIDAGPSFEIVSENTTVLHTKYSYNSNDSDSDSYYESLKNRKSKSVSKQPKLNGTGGKNLSVANENVLPKNDRNTAVRNYDSSKEQGSVVVSTPNVSQNRTVTQSNNSKPKMKPFGGTKMLYETKSPMNIEKSTTKDNVPSDSGLEQQQSSKLENAGNKSIVTVNQENTIFSEKTSKKSPKDSKVSKSCQFKKKENLGKGLYNNSPIDMSEEQDGNISASSADTDEIVNRSKSRSPNKVSIEFHNYHAISVQQTQNSGSKLAMSSNLKLSIVDEYLSGLVSGEMPSDDESSYSSADDTDESDFEKFALKETQKVKHMQINKSVLKNQTSLLSEKEGKIVSNKKLNEEDGFNSNDSMFDSGESEPDIAKSDIEYLTSKNSKKNKHSKDHDISTFSTTVSKDISEDKAKNQKGTLDLDKLPGMLNSCYKGNLSTVCQADSDESLPDVTESDLKKCRMDVSDDIDSESDTDNSKTGSSNTEVNVVKSTKVTEMSKIKTSTDKNAENKMATKNKKLEKTKKSDVDTNKKRLESLKQRQMENKAQKSAIQKALANIDGTATSNKKIIFNDSDGEEDTPSDSMSKNKPQTGQKQLSSEEDSSSSDDDDDDKSLEDEEEIKDIQEKGKKTPALFDSSDSEQSADEDTDMFKIRPEFEGKSGQRRMELQSRYGNDDRFKLDQRFIDSEDDSENEGQEMNEPINEDNERTRSLKILEEVVGTKIIKEKKGKIFRDVSALHFDPSREDHTQYEVKEQQQPKKEKKTKKKKELDSKEEETIEELPEVGKEKFFEVSDSLKNAFKSNLSEVAPQGFSLLSAFSSHGDEGHDSAGEEESEVKILKHKSSVFPWQQQFDDENSDSDQMESNDEMEVSKSDDEEPQKESVVFTATKPYFFFQENDDRISEGIKNFCRQESLEDIREKWLEKRPNLVEAYRAKHKRLLRKIKIDKKHSNKPVFTKRR